MVHETKSREEGLAVEGLQHMPNIVFVQRTGIGFGGCLGLIVFILVAVVLLLST